MLDDEQEFENELMHKKFITEKKKLTKPELLELANKLIKESDDYIDGIVATDVRQNFESLVFSGDYFLKEDGTPSNKTIAVFNVFKSINAKLSASFELEE